MRSQRTIMAGASPAGVTRGHNRHSRGVPRVPQRRPLGSQEGDRRRPNRPASTARRIFFETRRNAPSREGFSPLGGVKPLVCSSREREEGGCSAAPPRPGSPEGAGRRSEPEQPQLGKGGGASRGVPWLERVPPARAELLRVFETHFGDASRFSHRRWGERLDRVLARLDRYADFGAGRNGAGLEYAARLVEAAAEECRWDRGAQRPNSLAYFIPLLEEVSKQWRRTSAARVEQAPAGWRGSWAHPKKKKGRHRGERGAGRRSTNEGA